MIRLPPGASGGGAAGTPSYGAGACGGGGGAVGSVAYVPIPTAISKHTYELDTFEKIAKAASFVLDDAWCVAGWAEEGAGRVRVHVLRWLPADHLTRARRFLALRVAAHVSLEVTCLPPTRSGAIKHVETSIQIEAEGEACGGCGTRAVRNRRCGFCGARA